MVELENGTFAFFGHGFLLVFASIKLSNRSISVWLCGNVLSRSRSTYSTPGPVSAWTGYQLTILRRVNYLGAEPGTQVNSA